MYDFEFLERLGCRGTNLFVAATRTPSASVAAVSAGFGWAYRTACKTLDDLGIAPEQATPPPSYHQLGREGRLAWVRGAMGRSEVALGRLLRSEDLDLENQELDVAAIVASRGWPVAFVAVGEDPPGGSSAGELPARLGGMAKLRPYTTHDFRDAYPPIHDPRLVRIDQLLSGSLLDLGGASDLAQAS